MSLKIQVTFKSEGTENNISTRIKLQVESFEQDFEIPCNATNKPPLLRQWGVETQDKIFYCGMCWTGDRLDSV